MRYHTILFDLDGTLLDTLEDLTDAVNYVMERFGYPRHDVAAVRGFVGNGIRTLMVRCVPQGKEDPHLEACYRMFLDYYGAHANIKTRPYPGIVELLGELRRRGVRVAVVSNKAQEAVTGLVREYFAEDIPVAVGDGGGRARKPAPDGVREALRQLEAVSGGTTAVRPQGQPESGAAGVLYVGDSDVDSATAAGAGLDCLLVSWGFRPRALLERQRAVGIIDTPRELLQLL